METSSCVACDDGACATRLVDRGVGFLAAGCDLFGVLMDVSSVTGIVWPKKVGFRHIEEKFWGDGREKGVISQDYPFSIVGWFFKV